MRCGCVGIGDVKALLNVSFNVYRVVAGYLWFVNGGSSRGFGRARVRAYEGVVGAGVLRGHVLGFAEEGDIDVLGILIP